MDVVIHQKGIPTRRIKRYDVVVHIRAREEGFIWALMRCCRDLVVVFLGAKFFGVVGDEMDMRDGF
jgi:hypothetical protein